MGGRRSLETQKLEVQELVGGALIYRIRSTYLPTPYTLPPNTIVKKTLAKESEVPGLDSVRNHVFFAELMV